MHYTVYSCIKNSQCRIENYPQLIILSFPYYLATTLQPPLPTESSAEYNGDREYFSKFFGIVNKKGLKDGRFHTLKVCLKFKFNELPQAETQE